MVSPSIPPMSERDKRDAAVAELLSTEATYVSDMKLLVDVFVLPLERWAKDLEAARDSGAARDQSSVASDLTQHDCTLIFANVKQLANFNRQFLVDLRRAYGEPDPSGHEGMVSPVFRDSGDWKRVTAGGDDRVAAAAAAAAAAATAANNRLLDDDPFKPATAPDVDRGPRQMLEVFLKSAPFLKMYSLYVNNFDRARERLTTLERDNPSFAAFLTACERQKPCRGLRLRDFLILPVQRIPRYRLLLETILQHTPIASTMHSKVEESLTTMGGIAAKINEGVSLQRQKHKVYELQQEFGGANFVTASRIFIREGDLSKVARSGVEKLHFVLFNDLLVYGQAKKRRGVLRGGGKGKTQQLYHHRREINLSKCFVVDAPAYGTRSTSFLGETGMLVVAEEKCFMVMASTAVEKDAWLRAIRLCMRDLSTNVETRERMCGSQDYDDDLPRSPVSSQGRSSRWSVGSGNSPPAASAPRSVWVPGKDGQKSMRLVNFSLPPWAGVRTSCGCLSHTELIWGMEGLAPTGGGGGGGMAAGLAAALGIGNSQQQPQQQQQQQPMLENDNVDNTGQSGGAPQPSSDGEAPRKVSCVISMRPFEPMGLRLRDVHPGCGGGVVVVGFERKSSGKRAGMQQGDRITDVDGIPVSKTSDIVWALMQPRMDANTSPGRAVHLAVLRGFPKSEKPWLQPLMIDPSPLPAVLSPPSSAVESRSDEEPPAAALTAPGCRTFFSADGTPASRLSFGRSNSCGAIASVGSGSGVRNRGGGGGGGPGSVSGGSGCGGCVSLPSSSLLMEEAVPAEIMPAAVEMLPLPPPVPPPPRASYASYDSQPTMHAAQIAHDLHESLSLQPRVAGLLIAPPSPETKADYSGGDFSMDSSRSGECTMDSADSSAGAALRGPAPNQANDNAGGDPAKPFTTQAAQSLRRQPQQQQEEEGEEERLRTGSMGVGSALAACWTCQTDDPFQVSDDEGSKPTEYSHADAWASVQNPVVETLRDAVVGTCVGSSDGEDGRERVVGRVRGLERVQGDQEKEAEEEEEEDEEGEDSRSAASGSSAGSSMFLTAVSPSRIPPPLISMASTLPPPPISMASSVVSGSFSNPWYSPTNSNAGTPDTSMSWLKPLPPPPPRRDSADVQVGAAQPLSSTSRLSPPPPTAPARGNMALAYPSGRWVQTPPYGEPKASPGPEIATVVEKARGF